MELDELVALMAAALYDHNAADPEPAKRKLAVRDARLLLQEVQATKLYEPPQEGK
jgi:hypothetical protein